MSVAFAKCEMLNVCKPLFEGRLKTFRDGIEAGDDKEVAV